MADTMESFVLAKPRRVDTGVRPDEKQVGTDTRGTPRQSPVRPYGIENRHIVAHGSNRAVLGNAARSNHGPCATSLQRTKPWQLPARGLAVFHGPGETARLSHYFLPRLLLQGKNVLLLDGANCADPRLLERLARERGVSFALFNRQVRLARAFTCFQLTELIARVPRLLADFPAQVLVVTALPELYYDGDVRDWDARVAFEQALADLERWGRLPLAVAVFSAAPSFTPPSARRHFFSKTCAAATEVWEFSVGENHRLKLSLASTARAQPRLGGGEPAPAYSRIEGQTGGL